MGMTLTLEDIDRIECEVRQLAMVYAPCDQTLALCKAWRALDLIAKVSCGEEEIASLVDDTDGLRWINEHASNALGRPSASSLGERSDDA